MTAKELLDQPDGLAIKIAFVRWCGVKERSKRKAREFLATFGPKYGVRVDHSVRVPAINFNLLPCRLATTADINKETR
jgi:hypothetical protein